LSESIKRKEREDHGFEVRKVQKLGSTSLFITLPKKWVTKWNVRPGDKILIEMLNDGSLRLVSERFKQDENRKVARVDLSQIKLDPVTVVKSLYDLGFEEIILDFDRKDQIIKVKDQILNEVDKLFGLELSELAGENSIKLEYIVDDMKLYTETILKRLIAILSRKIDEIISLLNSKQPTEPISSDEMEKVYHLLLRKILNGEISVKVATKNYLTLMIILRIRDVFYELEELKTKLNNVKLDEAQKSALINVLSKYNDVQDVAVMSVLLSSIKKVITGLSLLQETENIIAQIPDPLSTKLRKINKMFYESLKYSIDIILLERLVYNLENELQNISK